MSTVISPELTRKLQLVSLDMALYFDKFCEENNLTYFLCGGCCIGTIRDKGFIPWDDDVDVFMPRADYEKLKKIWKDTKKYSIQFPTRDLQTENQFLTIHDNDTAFIKTYQKDLDINHGIMLDVIPIDGCPTGFARKRQKIWALMYSLFVVGKAPENHGGAITAIGRLLLGIFRGKNVRYKIWRMCERHMSKYKIEDCQFITELCTGPGYMKNEYPKECFERAIRKEFEGHMLPIPVGYDTYLKMAFGDYMQLPPEEKRVCHHEYEVIDTENSYLNYRGTKYCVK